MINRAEVFFDALREWGAADAAAARVPDGPAGLPFAVSIAVRLSDAVVDEIDDEPTYTYFHHYRTVNAFLDQLALKAGLCLQREGARYIAVAASQSVPAVKERAATPFEGRYSHKKAACLAGLGAMGRSNLFLHRAWGPRVRLATVFTDWEELSTAVRPQQEISAHDPYYPDRCLSCSLCADACPAGAIGMLSSGSGSEGPVFEAEKCSAWMKKEYQHIGRGAVCGICMRVCPCNTVNA